MPIIIKLPERGEIVIFTRDLKSRIPIGSKIIDIQCHINGYELGIARSSFPLEVKAVASKGKKTYVRFTNGMCLLVSYGMTASWRIKKTKFTRYSFHIEKEGVKEPRSVYYWQTKRGLHCETIEYLSNEEIDKRLAELGLDIYRDQPSDQEILNAYLTKAGKVQRKNVCAFLLDQRFFCGVGNYIKCMALFRCGISPYRTTDSLSKKEKLALFWASKAIVKEVVTMGGHTIEDWKPDDGRELDSYDTYPFGHKDSKDVKVEMIGGRVTYWVPSKQH